MSTWAQKVNPCNPHRHHLDNIRAEKLPGTGAWHCPFSEISVTGAQESSLAEQSQQVGLAEQLCKK